MKDVLDLSVHSRLKHSYAELSWTRVCDTWGIFMRSPRHEAWHECRHLSRIREQTSRFTFLDLLALLIIFITTHLIWYISEYIFLNRWKFVCYVNTIVIFYCEQNTKEDESFSNLHVIKNGTNCYRDH